MSPGTVNWFNPTKGFGFIESESGGNNVFVHISAVERAGISTLIGGDRIEYELAKGQNGKSSSEDLKLVS